MNTKFRADDVPTTGMPLNAARNMSTLRSQSVTDWTGSHNNIDTNILESPPLRSRLVR